MNNPARLVDDDTILMRTDAGQHAAFEALELDAPRLRLLRLVNGYTTLGGLATRLDPANDWHAAASTLLESRLVSIEGIEGRNAAVAPSPGRVRVRA